MLALLAACAMPGPYGQPGSPPPPLEPPTISRFLVECDLEGASWSITVDTTSWTGGSTSWWTVDGEYVEKHTLDTISYEPDGSAESLFAEIDIVADWRDLAPRNTGFTCASDPDVIVHVFDVDGNPVDCEVTGPQPWIWNFVPSTDPCPAETAAR